MKKSSFFAFKWIFGMFFLGFFYACTTYKTQMGSQATSFFKDHTLDSSAVRYRVFVMGNLGNDQATDGKKMQENFAKRIIQAGTKSTLVITGDAMHPYAGFPEPNDNDRFVAESHLKKQLALLKGYEGQTYFLPGESDWGKGVMGLILQDDFLKLHSNYNASLLPQNACGMSTIVLHESVLLVGIDSQWFLEDWDLHPEINAGCAIKTREMLLEELENVLANHQDKTILLGMHHPVMSHGEYGGQYSAASHLFPLNNNIPMPVVGSAIQMLRKASGWHPQDIHNATYSAMANPIKKIVQKHPNVVLVSGHENSLQYIRFDGIQQIISGSGSQMAPAKALHPFDFSYGGYGYAVVDLYDTGTATVSYYTTVQEKEVLLFKQQLSGPNFDKNKSDVEVKPIQEKEASVYAEHKHQSSDAYYFLWGKHYKDIYTRKINAPVLQLDTIYDGLQVVGLERLGLTNAILLKDKKGKEFWLSPLEKDAADFLQTVAFKNQTEYAQTDRKLAEDFIRDYFTVLHPYAPLIISNLANTLDLSHLKPQLFYIPMQKSLGRYQDTMGDGLFFLAEKPSPSQHQQTHFGNGTTIVDTEDVLHNIRIDKTYSIDQEAYVKARLFDMLIGDWDRGAASWRWSVHTDKGMKIYRPIAMQRDQAFAKYDGTLLSLLKMIPGMGQMHSYRQNIGSVKTFNTVAYPLDLAFLPDVTEQDWHKAAIAIQEQLTAAAIREAFYQLPAGMQDETTAKLQLNFTNRLKKLPQTAKKYYKLLQRTVLVVGTYQDDAFVVNRLPHGKVNITVYEGKKEPGNLIFDKNFSRKKTKEIWLFGLEGADEFTVEGERNNPIKIRLIGGQGLDKYRIENGKKVMVYDYEANKIGIMTDGLAKINLSDDYETNHYNYKKPKFNVFSAAPLFGYNPDDGLKLGLGLDYTVKGFKGLPFSQHHHLKSNYYFATEGYELEYAGIVKKWWHKWDLVIDANATTSNFAMNFFGYGNQSQNLDSDKGFDYNRVKISRFKVHPGLVWHTKQGSSFTLKSTFDSYRVAETPERFITETEIDQRIFDAQSFAGFGVRYDYKNYDNAFLPTLGMGFYGALSWNANLRDFNRRLPVLESGIHLVYKITPNGAWIFETTAKGKALMSNTFEFYQAATLGGDADLRGYRDQRFTGKQAFYHSSDVRYYLGQIKNPFAPVNYGLMVGFDYGRVWMPDEMSRKWHESAGFGLWFNSSNVIATQLSYFRSTDGGRLAFGMRLNY